MPASGRADCRRPAPPGTTGRGDCHHERRETGLCPAMALRPARLGCGDPSRSLSRAGRRAGARPFEAISGAAGGRICGPQAQALTAHRPAAGHARNSRRFRIAFRHRKRLRPRRSHAAGPTGAIPRHCHAPFLRGRILRRKICRTLSIHCSFGHQHDGRNGLRTGMRKWDFKIQGQTVAPRQRQAMFCDRNPGFTLSAACWRRATPRRVYVRMHRIASPVLRCCAPAAEGLQVCGLKGAGE